MNDETPPPGDSPAEQQPPQPNLRARVPDHVSGGVFSTGVIVMTRPTEIVLDFVQTIGRPQRVASRIVLPHAVLPQFIDALMKNVAIYTNRFGPPQAPPTAQQSQPAGGEPGAQPRRPSAEEIYDELQIPDAVLSGAYANGVMIGHGSTEFSLDFLTSFYPQSAVSARIFLSAGQVPRLLESLQGASKNLGQQPPPGGQQPPPNSPPSSPPSPPHEPGDPQP